MDPLEQSLRKVFIDREEEASFYSPRLIVNQPHKNEYLLNTLHEEIESCQRFFFSIAFITQDGLNSLKTQLSDLAKRGITGRMLTSTYLGFNHPDMFADLLKIPNLEVKISKKEGFHAKGYLFEHEDHHSLIIGSSNLTMKALKINYEWNVLLTSYQNGEMLHKIKNHIEEEWSQALSLNQKWLDSFKFNSPNFNPIKITMGTSSEEYQDYQTKVPKPNEMQKVALTNIQELRNSGESKGLVISATGTGKTYLAAFDVQQVKPKRVLFIVHREQILTDAKSSFQKILGGADSDYGILSGNKKENQAKYIFATIQTISKDKYLQEFTQEYFDYILIDEVHKAGAKTYLKVMDYFEPKFLLGMTATPERTDNFNIFELFDYNVAYEIRLKEALEADFLCPFHYFGVADYEKDGEIICETSELQSLVAEERVKYLLEKIDYYGCSGSDVKGLVFCSRKEEAKELSELFTNRGIPSSYLVGDHSIEERENQILKLEKGRINYIFTVDVFNEGIDIPKVNQIIMLRNTNSSIIFIQQLGRGLRKHISKQFVTVIDFIGNYQNNYMIPMALTGASGRTKDSLRQGIYKTDYLSGISAVNFEQITKERIFESIDLASLDSMKMLRNKYIQLKNRLNRIPLLIDFYETKLLEPLLIANKFKNYYQFLVKMKDEKAKLTEIENKYLTFVTREVLPGMRKHEIILLQEFISRKTDYSIAELKLFFSEHDLVTDEETIKSVINTLSLSFFSGGDLSNYKGASFICFNDSRLTISNEFKKVLTNPYFVELLVDYLHVASENAREYLLTQPLTLYKKYKRKDVIRLLNWEKQLINQNIGGYTSYANKFVIFITLDKGEKFTGAQMAYEDKILDTKTLHWLTKSPRTLDSPEVQIMKEPKEWEISVFVKKSDDEGTDFYYLGEVTPKKETIKEMNKLNQEGELKKVVEMSLIFKQPLDYQLFKYLTSID